MNDDNHGKIAAPDKGGHFERVKREAQTARSQRLGKEAGVRPRVNTERPRST